jgi:Cu+-exporting ATPase
MEKKRANAHEHVLHSQGADTTAPTVTDPVCGMKVNPANAKYACAHDGQQYFFCSQRCLTKFQAQPATYVQPSREHSPQQSTDEKNIYTCPMHPEVRQRGPGSCPQCGMALEPLTASVPAARTEYVCPMHPEVVLTEPGACPLCGMTL